MSNYVKPAIKLTTVGGARIAGSCSTTSTDIEIIESIVGKENLEMAFGMNEGCAIPFDMYCKFTSAEMGLATVFSS